ncbi:MAG: molybdopterin-dependent oxidoreductase [Acetobacteraceae bacterium]|nr:molybdopterin-dependent oxidoreductase [Acetobacteraceae bacterium]
MACPLNCWDGCALKLERTAQGISLRGDPEHEITRGFCCPKPRRLLERLCGPDRVRQPLVRPRRGAGLQPASWTEALDRVAEALALARDRFGPTSILHYFDTGSMGALRSLDSRFFDLLGGASEPVGSLCWSAGLAAQRFDFGASLCHDPADHVSARTIILWGRNPAATNVHLLPFLEEARRRGALVAVVDPLPTATARWADFHLAPRPGTDGALALGMAQAIIRDGLVDRGFVSRAVAGFDEFAGLASRYPPERAAEITGVSSADIEALARRYARSRPGCILMGYGFQRYTNGGAAVRAVDALAAISGNIGVPGGGANYAHLFLHGSLASLAAPEGRRASRKLPRAVLPQALASAHDPPVKVAVITRSNPLAQMPQVRELEWALRRLDLVVLVDGFLTDTAGAADVILPCTLAWEDEDLYFCSWHSFLTLSEAALEPPGEARPELDIWQELAVRLGLGPGLARTREEWLKVLLAPLAPAGLTPDNLRGRSVRHPFAPRVPWEEGRFLTPSGRFELFSPSAASQGLDPLPTYREPAWSASGKYPLVLLSPQHRDTIHSQLGRWAHPGPLVEVGLAPEAAEAAGIADGQRVRVETPVGAMPGRARLVPGQRPEAVRIYAGGWVKDGLGVNLVTPSLETDMGHGGALYDCPCRVVPEPSPSPGGGLSPDPAHCHP